MSAVDFDLSDPRLDSESPPDLEKRFLSEPVVTCCGECDVNRAGAELALFANGMLRTRVQELEHRLATTLDYVEELEGLAHALERQVATRDTPVFADEAPAGSDHFGLIDPPIVAEVVADPFLGGAAATSASGAESESCGERCRDGSGRVCDLPANHDGACASIGADGRPELSWGRSRV